MLLYNNRWICLLPFARKPDPRRVSKQVSREPPQAEKIRGVLRSPCSSRSGFACAALAEQQHVPPLVIHKGPREGKSLLQKRLCAVFLFLRGR